THYWNPDRMYSSTTAPEFAGYQVLVGEVAGMLADMAPGRIALEPVNEPPQDCSSEVWPKVQAALLTAARGSARKLPLLATGGCGSMVRGLTALDPAPLADYEPILF
ncbi:glycosyl hydrolase family 5, partial [bacterium M00.F.Ca.ET.228.01.1.1]